VLTDNVLIAEYTEGSSNVVDFVRFDEVGKIRLDTDIILTNKMLVRVIVDDYEFYLPVSVDLNITSGMFTTPGYFKAGPLSPLPLDRLTSKNFQDVEKSGAINVAPSDPIANVQVYVRAPNAETESSLRDTFSLYLTLPCIVIRSQTPIANPYLQLNAPVDFNSPSFEIGGLCLLYSTNPPGQSSYFYIYSFSVEAELTNYPDFTGYLSAGVFTPNAYITIIEK